MVLSLCPENSCFKLSAVPGEGGGAALILEPAHKQRRTQGAGQGRIGAGTFPRTAHPVHAAALGGVHFRLSERGGRGWLFGAVD